MTIALVLSALALASGGYAASRSSSVGVSRIGRYATMLGLVVLVSALYHGIL